MDTGEQLGCRTFFFCVTRTKLKEYNLVTKDQEPIQLYDKRENLIEVQRIKKDPLPVENLCSRKYKIKL